MLASCVLQVEKVPVSQKKHVAMVMMVDVCNIKHSLLNNIKKLGYKLIY